MIDTNKLRMLAQAALAGPDGISLSWIKPLQDFQQEASPAAISELLDRLEAAESARRDDYQNWMTALDRNAELLAKLEAAEKERDWHAERCEDAMNECDALRAKVAEMEQQESVAEIVSFGGPDLKEVAWEKGKMPALGSKLYALPGAQAQPAPSVPVVTPKMEQAFYEKVEVTSVGSIRGLADGIKAAMLAAAPAGTSSDCNTGKE